MEIQIELFGIELIVKGNYTEKKKKLMLVQTLK
jgi:hypothetical protein